MTFEEAYFLTTTDRDTVKINLHGLNIPFLIAFDYDQIIYNIWHLNKGGY